MNRCAFRLAAKRVPDVAAPRSRPARPVRPSPLVPIVLSLLTGCATPGLAPDRSPGAPPGNEERAPSPRSSNVRPPEARTYRVQAGDLLEVQFFFNPELNQSVRVQPDGAITLPFLGTRSVRGMSIPDVSEMVREVFAAELRQPQVAIQLIEAAPRQVYVGGAVNRPQEVAYRADLTPLEAVLAAGGFSSNERASRIVLIRKDAEGRSVPTVIDPRETVTAAMVLEPWDIVYVLQDRKANGWITQYLRAL